MNELNFQQILSAFIVLFAIIDILGSIPIIVSLKQTGRSVDATKATLISTALLVAFFYGSDLVLQLFNINISSFAIAGAFIIFLMSLEMILDVEIFKNQGPIKSATLIPLVFPLIAGAGAFTTLLSLKSQYADVNILIGLALNMIVVFFVVKLTDKIQKLIGQGGIYITRKFFGIILLAISVKLFVDNAHELIQTIG